MVVVVGGGVVEVEVELVEVELVVVLLEVVVELVVELEVVELVVEEVVLEVVDDDVVELLVVEEVVELEVVVLLLVVVGAGVVVVVGCGVGPIHVTCPVTGLIVRYDPTVSGGPLFVKLSVVTFEPDKLFITSELPLLGTSTPMPAIPHVHSRLAKGLFPGSKSPCGVPIIG